MGIYYKINKFKIKTHYVALVERTFFYYMCDPILPKGELSFFLKIGLITFP